MPDSMGVILGLGVRVVLDFGVRIIIGFVVFHLILVRFRCNGRVRVISDDNHRGASPEVPWPLGCGIQRRAWFDRWLGDPAS